MSTYKSLNSNKYLKSGKIITPDFIYWKKLSVPTLVKEFGAIDYIDISPLEPYYFAVTCSVRVQIYNPITKLVVKNLSRFQETAYGGSFRKDGRLLVAGDQEGFVKLFDTTSKNVLRMFRGHQAAVHRTFFTTDLHRIASFSDDKTVKLWDIASENMLNNFEEHTDYVRAGCVSPVSPNIILSGGYDHLVKMYDSRSETVAFSVDHGSPVESLMFLPTGGIFLSAGGTEIKVWDALAGGGLLAVLSQHHKTVTCLGLASNGRRILSGSLDRHVKVYDVATYSTVHNIDFPSSILSLAVAPNDQTLAVGMVDGLVSIQNMEGDVDTETVPPGTQKRRIHANILECADQVVEDYKQKMQSKHDQLLRKYEYSKALDSVLKAFVVNKSPHITVSLMQELIHRKGLHRALAGRTHNSIAAVITFIQRYIGEDRFTRTLTDVANALLDVYEDSFNQFTGEIGKMFIKLSKTLQREIDLTYDLLKLQGVIEMISAASKACTQHDHKIQFTKKFTNLPQSELAKKIPVINVD